MLRSQKIKCASSWCMFILIFISVMCGAKVKDAYADRNCQEVADRALDQWYLQYIAKKQIYMLVNSALAIAEKEQSDEDKQAKFKEILVQKLSMYLHEQINEQKAIPGCTKNVTLDQVKNSLFYPKSIKEGSQTGNYLLSGAWGLGSAAAISGVVAAYGVMSTGVIATALAGGTGAVAYSWFTGPVIASIVAAGSAVTAGSLYMYKKSTYKKKIKEYSQGLRERFLENKEKLRISLRQMMN